MIRLEILRHMIKAMPNELKNVACFREERMATECCKYLKGDCKIEMLGMNGKSIGYSIKRDNRFLSKNEVIRELNFPSQER